MVNALSLVGKESIIKFNKWMQLKFDYEWQKVFLHVVWSAKTQRYTNVKRPLQNMWLGYFWTKPMWLNVICQTIC